MPSPCVFGLLRPAIYVTEAAAADEAALADVLRHERAHLAAHDQLWALVRTACLIVWWFHPLVWLAARLARRDCEIACDERALRGLDAKQRAHYGRTLLTLASVPGQLAAKSAAAGLSTGRELPARIRAIAGNRKPRRAAMLLAALLALLAAGCSFTGAPQGGTAFPEQTETEQTDAPEAGGTDAPAAPANPTPDTGGTVDPAALPTWAEGTAAEAWIGGWCGVVDETDRWAPGTDDAAALSALLNAAASLPDDPEANAKFLIDCWACLLARGSELTGRSWASSDALSGVFGAMSSRLGGLDMPLETDTLGEWWEAYLALAHRSYAAGDPCPDSRSDALIWTLAQMSRTSPTPTSLHLRLSDGTAVQTAAYAALAGEWSAQPSQMTAMCDELFVRYLAAHADELMPLGAFDLDAAWTLDAEGETAVLTIAKPGGAELALTCAMDEQAVRRADAPGEAADSAPPAEAAAADYYFMGSVYGMGDNPGFSTLFAEQDSLSRLKQFYHELGQTVERVEYHTQSLDFVGPYTGDARFSSSGSVNDWGDDGRQHTPLKTLMIGRSEFGVFDGFVESGRNFTADDFTVDAVTDAIPVVLGHDYLDVYDIGDELSLSLHLQPLTFTVVGFLAPGTTLRFNWDIPLDQAIVVPFYDIAYDPADAANEYYQQVYYTQKCEGFVRIDPAADAGQMFEDVWNLAQKYDLLCRVTPKALLISEPLHLYLDA